MGIPSYLFVPLLALILLITAMMAARLIASWKAQDALVVAERDADRIALADEKQRVLVTLKDLEHEHALGKLSDEDYEGLVQYYEHEAIRLMAELDALDAASAEAAAADEVAAAGRTAALSEDTPGEVA